MDKLRLLKAVYNAIQWDRLYGELPEATREQVDELFRDLRERLAAALEPPDELAAKVRGGAALLYCDGASRGNPGPAGVGMVLATEASDEVLAWGAPIGRATNNVAEYRAVVEGLKRALALGVERVTVLSDSELLVRQLQGSYRVKNAGLKPLHAEAVELLGQFEQWEARHVGREANARADALAAEHARGRQNQ